MFCHISFNKFKNVIFSVFKYRIELKLTQEALADKSNLNTRTIQRIENGEEVPSLETLAKLVIALNIKDKDLVNYIKEFNYKK